MLIKPADSIIFADDEVEEEFNNFSDDNILKKGILRIMDKFKQNVFCGDGISKKIIPKIYPAAKTSEFSPRMRLSPLSHKVQTNLGFKAEVKIQGLCDVNKYGIDNLWVHPLPDGWRLVYSVLTPSKDEIQAMIIEWFNHKDYERRFKYG